MDIFKNLFIIGEQKTFHELVELIELGRKANSIMLEMVSSGRKNDALIAHNEDMRLLEKQADQLAFKVKEDIVGGAVNPNILGDLLDCVEFADSIVDNYYFASREMKRIAGVKFDDSFTKEIPELNSEFDKMLRLTDQALMILTRILKTTNFSEIDKLRNEIELVEEEGDNVKDDGFDRLYAAAPSIHYLQFSHYTELLHKFDDALDSCEDISDLVVVIITSISK